MLQQLIQLQLEKEKQLQQLGSEQGKCKTTNNPQECSKSVEAQKAKLQQTVDQLKYVASTQMQKKYKGSMQPKPQPKPEQK